MPRRILSGCRIERQVDQVLSDRSGIHEDLSRRIKSCRIEGSRTLSGTEMAGRVHAETFVRVTVNIPEQLDLMLPEDQAVLLFQSVRELLINTSKYAGTGEASVELEYRDDQLRIHVRDQGAGFDVAATPLLRRRPVPVVIQIWPVQYPGTDAGTGRIVRHSICPWTGSYRHTEPCR